MPCLDPKAPLAQDYTKLWAAARIQPRHAAAVGVAAHHILVNKARYEDFVERGELPIPAWFVGIVHMMECGCDFGGHLHNGDPLTARTRDVPAGRPPLPLPPPVKWEDSAADALAMRGTPYSKEYLWDGDWSIASTLYKFERYNGLGYRQYHKDVLSPYLWSFTTLYDCAPYPAGKYRSDGKWSATLVSKQAGAAALLKYFVQIGAVTAKGGRFV